MNSGGYSNNNNVGNSNNMGGNTYNPPVSDNTNAEKEIQKLDMLLRTRGSTVQCPFPNCRYVGMTRSERKCSIGSYCTCFFCHCCWTLHRLLKAKDFSCWDVEHTCVACSSRILTYNSC